MVKNIIIIYHTTTTTTIPGNLLKVKLPARFATLRLVAVLLPHVRFVRHLLVVERRLQMVHGHLLVVDGRDGRRHWRHDPHPVGGTTISICTNENNYMRGLQ